MGLRCITICTLRVQLVIWKAPVPADWLSRNEVALSLVAAWGESSPPWARTSLESSTAKLLSARAERKETSGALSVMRTVEGSRARMSLAPAMRKDGLSLRYLRRR